MTDWCGHEIFSRYCGLCGGPCKLPNGPAHVTPLADTAMHLPESAADRKAIPMATGLIDYFPDALMAVAALSKIGNDQHNPGKPLHWDRAKSTDEADCLVRHFVDRGTVDTDGVRHSAKVAWRALALLQKEIETAKTTLVTGR